MSSTTFSEKKRTELSHQSLDLVHQDGVLMRAVLQATGLSRSQLADRLGVKRQTIYDWTADSVPRKRAMKDSLRTQLQALLSASRLPEMRREKPYEIGRKLDTVLRDETPSIGIATQCHQHLERFLRTCGDDPARLGWTRVTLEETFPLDKWGRKTS